MVVDTADNGAALIRINVFPAPKTKVETPQEQKSQSAWPYADDEIPF